MRFRLGLLLLFASAARPAETVRIAVFTLFKPTELIVRPAGNPLQVTAAGVETILEGRRLFRARLAQTPARVTGRDGAAADFRLSIPGKIDRQFHGTLTIEAGDHKLIAIVSMDREDAVASVVAAEMRPGTPIEALKAQAVAARSYYLASAARHDGYDFCDTTHCQFLRERPEPANAAARAAEETRGLVLEYLGAPVAALYSASCGGRTRPLDDPAGYSYRSVDCEFCRRHSPGVVQGHQLGLCQAGARGMAAGGADFRAILDHYYPGTSLGPGGSRKARTPGTNAPTGERIFFLRLSASLSHSKK